MNKFFVRILSALLLVLMLVSSVACAETSDDPTDGTTAPAETVGGNDSVVDETTAVNAENILGLRDLTGQTVTFYSRLYNGTWESDLFVDDLDGTVLNDAIYTRNTTISEKYGVKLEQIASGNITFRDDVANRISSGDTTYQVLYMGLADAANAAQSGYLQDMTAMENINLGGH